jgi:plastocyanin
MRRTFFIVAVLALCAALAACGGGSDDEGSDALGKTDSSKASITNDGKNATILMSGSSFQPPLMIVILGTKITWVNKDDVQHDVESTAGEKIDSPLFGKDQTFSFTPTKVGAIEYVCTVHPGMKARIQIEKAGG